MLRSTCGNRKATMGSVLMDTPSKEFALAGSLEELKVKGRLVVHGDCFSRLVQTQKTLNRPLSRDRPDRCA